MSKLWTMIPLMLFFIACETFVPAIGGDGGGRCNGISKKHPDKIPLGISLTCQYERPCEAALYFGLAYFLDTLSSRCGYDYELYYVSNENSRIIRSNETYTTMIPSNEHIQFSLFDESNVERKFDIDLSRIIHSYTVKGDSVEVAKFDCMNRLSIYKKRFGSHDIIELYPDSLKNGHYAFYKDSLYKNEIHFECGLGAQGSFKTDSVFVYGNLYWR